MTDQSTFASLPAGPRLTGNAHERSAGDVRENVRSMRVTAAPVRFASLVVLALLTACAPAGPAPVTAPAPVPVPAPADSAPPRPTRVTIAAHHDTLRYEVVSTARVERDSAGQPNTEEVSTRALVSFAMERIGNPRMGSMGSALDLRSTGRVDGFVITSSDRITGSRSSALPGVTEVPSRPRAPLTVPFDATLNGLTARVAPRPALANECDQPEMSALSLVRELLVRLPRELEVGQSWSDTTRAFMCRGGLPITVQHVATATVRELARGSSGEFTRVLIDRSISTRMEGELRTSWRSVGLRGTGTGTQQLVLDAVRGALVELRSESTTELSVHDSVRRDQGQQAVTQRVTLTARMVP